MAKSLFDNFSHLSSFLYVDMVTNLHISFLQQGEVDREERRLPDSLPPGRILGALGGVHEAEGPQGAEGLLVIGLVAVRGVDVDGQAAVARLVVTQNYRVSKSAMVIGFVANLDTFRKFRSF